MAPPARYHLLLVRSSDAGTFEELVAANGVIRPCSGWLACVESALSVSSVEVDARLARWSQQTGGLAVRITRPDPGRFWLAVHHAGERLLVMVHSHAPEVVGNVVRIGKSDLGRDPLLSLVTEPTDELAWTKVAETRADELSDALAQGDVHVTADALFDVLKAPPGEETKDRVAAILDALDARDVWNLISAGPQLWAGKSEGDQIKGVVGQYLGRAMLSGCLVPMITGTVVFLTMSHLARSANLGMFGMVLAFAAAWSSMSFARDAAARVTSAAPWRRRPSLIWAQPSQTSAPGAPKQPVPQALDTWGGLFYLLRDIAFFGGIDRPEAGAGLYLESWAFGPPPLVSAVNRAVDSDADNAISNRLIDAAHGLIELRRELIGQHLRGDSVEATDVKERVHRLLAPALARPTSE
ncbi:MAG: hypothetical protein ACI9OJ_002265 [Myxococcota bacterium]|jgi:hypothetical protein